MKIILKNTHKSDSSEDPVPNMSRWSNLSHTFYLHEYRENKGNLKSKLYIYTVLYTYEFWYKVLTKWIVVELGELHAGLAVLSVDDVVPLDGLHVAQLVTGEAHSSIEDF